MPRTKCPFCKLDRAIEECWKHFSLTSTQSALVCQQKIVAKEGLEHTCEHHWLPLNVVATMKKSLPESKLETVMLRRDHAELH